MKFNRIVITWLIIAVVLVIPASAKDWRGLVPLFSTRADVERLLGQPSKQSLLYISFYDLEKESLRIIYSYDPCVGGIGGAWNVPRGTVLEIRVNLKKEQPLGDFKLDGYKKVDDPHILSNVYYVNEEEGIIITAFFDMVTSIDYVPAAKDERLRCSAEAAPNKSLNRTRNKRPSQIRRQRRAG